jgi:hypothetical protein
MKEIELGVRRDGFAEVNISVNEMDFNHFKRNH